MASTSAAGDKVEKALSDMRRFAVDVLPRVTTASNLDERSVERSFALARRVKRVLNSATFKRRLETALMGDAALWGERYTLQQLADAPKTLYLAVLDNPRSSKTVVAAALRAFEADVGFADCDAREAARKRNSLRKLLVAAADILRADDSWNRRLQMELAGKWRFDGADKDSILNVAAAARVKSEWTPKGIERLEELDASSVVDLCHEIKENEKDALLLVKGVETNKTLALAILRHCKSAWTNSRTRELVEWLIVGSPLVRGLFREESDVAVGYTISKLKKLLTEQAD